MPDPTDPPRKNKRAKRTEPDLVIDPSKPNATIELETADLLNMGQSGLVQPAVNKTRELQMADLEELREGAPVDDPKIIVDLGPDPNAAPKEQNVFVDPGLGQAVTPVNVQRVTATVPKVQVSTPRGITRRRATKSRGMGLVVLVYVLSAAALAVSIYFRWFA